MEPLPLEKAVEEYVEFIRLPHVELPYEERQQLRHEKLRQMIVALDARKQGAA